MSLPSVLYTTSFILDYYILKPILNDKDFIVILSHQLLILDFDCFFLDNYYQNLVLSILNFITILNHLISIQNSVNFLLNYYY